MATDLLAKMHDIQGLDPIGFWPLAIGWWLIIISSLVGLILLIICYRWQQNYKNSWTYAAYKNLLALEAVLATQEKKYIITELSLLLRQIAIKKYPREDCASISGQAWLTWLTAHDKKKFNWCQYGEVLILGPYAPNLQNIDNKEIKTLIQAAKGWVK